MSQVKSSFSALKDKSQTEDDAQLPEATEEPVVDLPVDFAALEEINPDIYAWVEIPCTTINYPVLQHPTKDEYYNDHGADGKYSPYGSIFSQASYNGRDFHEPVTVLYGHNLVYGMENMFAMLNNYADADFFDAHDTIYISTRRTVCSNTASLPHMYIATSTSSPTAISPTRSFSTNISNRYARPMTCTATSMTNICRRGQSADPVHLLQP